MAPMSNSLAHSQTRSLNASSKWRSTCIMALGRSRMVHPFLQVRRETSVPCLSCFVYQMDKVELRIEEFKSVEIIPAISYLRHELDVPSNPLLPRPSLKTWLLRQPCSRERAHQWVQRVTGGDGQVSLLHIQQRQVSQPLRSAIEGEPLHVSSRTEGRTARASREEGHHQQHAPRRLVEQRPRMGEQVVEQLATRGGEVVDHMLKRAALVLDQPERDLDGLGVPARR